MRPHSFIPNGCCGPCMHCKLYSEGQPEKFLNCSSCKRCIHLDCIGSNFPYERLLGDNFFTFTCVHCSQPNLEHIRRADLSILQIAVLALYNLQQDKTMSVYSSVDGFYHYKNHIFTYIRNNWNTLFRYDSVSLYREKKQFKFGSLSGVMSTSPMFISKNKEKRCGFYRLAELVSPAYLLHKYVYNRGKKRQNSLENPVTKKRAVLTSGPSTADDSDSDQEFIMTPDLPSRSNGGSSIGSEFADDDANSEITQHSESSQPSLGVEKEEGTVQYVSRFSRSKRDPIPEQNKNHRIVPLSRYEEERLLKLLDGGGEFSLELRQMRRKLQVRLNHLEHNKPIFNIDREVRFLENNGRLMNASERRVIDDFTVNIANKNRLRILDRFQVCRKGFDMAQKKQTSFYSKLMGVSTANDCDKIFSPYSLKELPPFIFRDKSIRPLKLRLLTEIASRAAKKCRCKHSEALLSQYAHHSIDFRYVAPKHIFPINRMAREFFWPGIDLSEILQYPDFTCVACFRHLVIGFGVVVPDTSLNEAYLSFLVVHPEWRQAGIASFILYHLIQICRGKDITLHVSATNPAMILYQQFGFKVEEFLSEFYEKYLPVNSQECRHALFLRLRR